MRQPHTRSSAPWAIVEIAGEFDPAERRGLIEAAYRSSRSGLVGLALRGVSRQAVDRVLDDVVDMRNAELGVIYIDGEDESALLDLAARAQLVIAATARFHAQLGERGIVALGVREGTPFLARSARGDRLAAVAHA